MKLGAILPEALRNLFSKPVTRNYPFEESKISDTYRGKLKFTQPLCIGCKLCMRDCPADALEVVKVADKKFKLIYRMDKCIYCGQCVNSCPKKALEMTLEYTLANNDKGKLIEEQGELLTVETAAAAANAVAAKAEETARTEAAKAVEKKDPADEVNPS